MRKNMDKTKSKNSFSRLLFNMLFKINSDKCYFYTHSLSTDSCFSRQLLDAANNCEYQEIYKFRIIPSLVDEIEDLKKATNE